MNYRDQEEESILMFLLIEVVIGLEFEIKLEGNALCN